MCVSLGTTQGNELRTTVAFMSNKTEYRVLIVLCESRYLALVPSSYRSTFVCFFFLFFFFFFLFFN
jgi:hypothetical protein